MTEKEALNAAKLVKTKEEIDEKLNILDCLKRIKDVKIRFDIQAEQLEFERFGVNWSRLMRILDTIIEEYNEQITRINDELKRLGIEDKGEKSNKRNGR